MALVEGDGDVAAAGRGVVVARVGLQVVFVGGHDDASEVPLTVASALCRTSSDGDFELAFVGDEGHLAAPLARGRRLEQCILYLLDRRSFFDEPPIHLLTIFHVLIIFLSGLHRLFFIFPNPTLDQRVRHLTLKPVDPIMLAVGSQQEN